MTDITIRWYAGFWNAVRTSHVPAPGVVILRSTDLPWLLKLLAERFVGSRCAVRIDGR